MKVYYMSACPLSSKLRILLKFLKISHESIYINDLNSLQKIKHINFSYFPILQSENNYFSDISTIILFLFHTYSSSFLKQIFNNYNIFHNETYFDKHVFFMFCKPIVYALYDYYIGNVKEIVLSTKYIEDLNMYLTQLNDHFKNYEWFYGNFSINDMSCFSILSSLSYFGIIEWEIYTYLKKYYLRLKSNDNFNFILNDQFFNIPPSKLYTVIDF